MANRAFPSMTALLGLLAVAGYQNREKISEVLSGRDTADQSATPEAPGRAVNDFDTGSSRRSNGLQRMLTSFAGTSGVDKLVGSGLSELADLFRQKGQSETVESWIGRGENKEISGTNLEQTLGSDLITELSEKTGLPRDELLARLSRELPSAVDQYTPEGTLATS